MLMFTSSAQTNFFSQALPRKIKRCRADSRRLLFASIPCKVADNSHILPRRGRQDETPQLLSGSLDTLLPNGFDARESRTPVELASPEPRRSWAGVRAHSRALDEAL